MAFGTQPCTGQSTNDPGCPDQRANARPGSFGRGPGGAEGEMGVILPGDMADQGSHLES